MDFVSVLWYTLSPPIPFLLSIPLSSPSLFYLPLSLQACKFVNVLHVTSSVSSVKYVILH